MAVKSVAEDLIVKNILNAIEDVTEWYNLGIQLNIKIGQLNAIRADCPNDTNGAKTKMIDYWLNNDPNASWEKLAAALKQIGYGNLSTRLMPQSSQDGEFSQSTNNTETTSETASSSCTAVSLLPRSSQPEFMIHGETGSPSSSAYGGVYEDEDRPRSPLNILNTELLIYKLEAEFGELVKGINEYLKDDERKIAKLQNILRYKLPLRLKGMRHHLTYQSVTLENFDKFFDDLEGLWNFLDYDLLKSIIIAFENADLKSKLSVYEKNVENFCAETTVTEFIKYWQPKFDITEDFKKCVMELSLDPTTCKVKDIKAIQKKLKATLPHELAMAAFCLFDIKQSTIKVIWLVWSELVPQLSDIMRSILEDNPNFVVENNILCFTLNGIILYSSYNDQGDTIENVAIELMNIENTGEFYFVFENDSQGSFELNKGTLFLQYKISVPNKASTSHEDSQCDGEDNFRIERKNIDQINDFVRKLGFLDKDQKGEEYIKFFLHTSEMAYKLLNLYQRLTELGHPRFISKSINIERIHCSRDISAVDNQVERVKKLLHEWSVEVSKLQKYYHWLLYFNMPKLLQLHKLLNSTSRSKQDIDKILLEIQFLEWSSSYKTATSKIKDALQQCHDKGDSDSPLNFVGQFLNIILKNYEVPKYLKFGKMDRNIDQTNICHQPLYCYPNASNEAIICLLLGLYSEIPKAYSVLHCQPLTSESELKLFMERAKQHPSQYSMLGVNKLPFKLQEQLVEIHINMQQSDYESEDRSQSTSISSNVSTIFFVETSPSILHEIPGIDLKDANEVMMSRNDAKHLCSHAAQKFDCIELVHGSAGDGKTHYIKEKLKECEVQCIIALNEAFSLKNTISKLRELPYNEQGVGIFFNFSLLPPKENGTKISLMEKKRYQELIDIISCFFFDLFILGYIEDSKSGLSFAMPLKSNWRIYVEVPSRDMKMTTKEVLKLFYNDVPALYMVGSEHYIEPNTPYKVDSDVQLVCKYLQAYKLKGNKEKSINQMYSENYGVVKFSTMTDLTEKTCWNLLKEYMPDFIAEKKIMQQLFIRYMKRRCHFLDTLPAFNFNEGKVKYVSSITGKVVIADTSELGSTLMATMLQEVERFCDPKIKSCWSSKSHQQLIYDFKDAGSSFGLISLAPERLNEQEKKKFKRMGVEIPSPIKMYDREVLDGYLSRALGVSLNEKRLAAIDESNYILTLDYTIKMLNIHERHECGIPVIIEGETGVGKTALMQMLSELWNQALHLKLKNMQENLIIKLKSMIGKVDCKAAIASFQHCSSALDNIIANKATKEDCHSICSYKKGNNNFLNIVLEYLKYLRNDTIIPLLIQNDKKQYNFDELFVRANELQNSDSTADLLYALLNAKILPLFHKVNVHAGLTPSDIKTQLSSVFKQAYQVHTTYSKILNDSKKNNIPGDTTLSTKRRRLTREERNIAMETSVEPALMMPYVTVFFDEINTSSCLGLFKEIIIDRMLDGEAIPENIFIVAACNPHRGNSMESHGNSMNPLSERWMHGSYLVHSLHPSIEHLKWDYGSLMESQERDYINVKMKNVNKDMVNAEVSELSITIIMSQNSMRDFALQQLKKYSKGISWEDLKPYSHSCVSQRDIQRVFTFYTWFKTLYEEIRKTDKKPEIHRRALYMSLGIVYYMRLNTDYRKQYKDKLDSVVVSSSDTKFSKIYDEELNFFIEKVNPPSGIARTTALKENILAIIVCTATRTPLIIVGEPGSSKTLSFNLTIGSLKGQESKTDLFRNTNVKEDVSK